MTDIYVTYEGNGSQTDFTFPFPYLRKAHVIVSLDGVETTAFTMPTASSVRITPAPAAGVTVMVFRRTETTPIISWPEGATIGGSKLNTAQIQALYVAEEARELGSEYGAILEDITDLAEAADEDAAAAAASAAAAQAARDQTLAVGLQDGTIAFADFIADNFDASFDGVEDTFDITVGAEPFSPLNAASILVHLNGAYQEPGAAYTVSGSTITFTTAPVAGDECIIQVKRTNAVSLDVGFTPAGSISSTTVQEAIEEVDTDLTSLTARVTTAEGEIDALQAADTALDGRLDTAESEIDALQAADVSLDSRLDTVEAELPNKQPLNANLTAHAALTLSGATNRIIYYTTAGTATLTTISNAARTFIGLSTVDSMLANLGGAPLASPAFTGAPTAPAPDAAEDSDRIATTNWVKARLAGTTYEGHTHDIGDIIGLQTALDGKSAVGHTHATSAITGLDTTLASLDTRLDTAESEIDALQAADVSLDGRLDTLETFKATIDTPSEVRSAAGLSTVLIDDISGSFNGSTTVFDLKVSTADFTPRSVYNVFVLLNGVMQEPGVSYTVAGADITFSVAPEAGDSCRIWIIHV